MTYNLKPIVTEADHDAAMAEFTRLWGAEENTPDGDKLVLLSILIEKYEDEHFPMNIPDPIDMILFMMEQNNLTRKDLEPLIGGSGRVSEVLNRKRGLSIEMIRALHDRFHIPAEILIRPTFQAA